MTLFRTAKRGVFRFAKAAAAAIATPVRRTCTIVRCSAFLASTTTLVPPNQALCTTCARIRRAAPPGRLWRRLPPLVTQTLPT
jgi:hypothetical protein